MRFCAPILKAYMIVLSLICRTTEASLDPTEDFHIDARGLPTERLRCGVIPITVKCDSDC